MDQQRAQAIWELQDAYEKLVLARAHAVGVLREIRLVVREPRNRAADRRRGRVPYYTRPEDVIAALRGFQHLAYLVHPGRRNRVKPEILLRRYESAVSAVDALSAQVDEMERAQGR